jgi:nitroimidazol reductase NimA-like FMN-containing flavoprotein (pyridoxamine 5'-phosphate oxidase superfamily)
MISKLDQRFSAPDAQPTPWPEALRVLDDAELYWLTTVRQDGRPHVTPLIGVVEDEVVHFCTGLEEQKARNLEHNDSVALTTGTNAWASGLDVVVEGTAVRISDDESLRRLADAWEAKYGSEWHWEVADGLFRHADGGGAAVFRVEPAKVLAFAKDPHAQTTYRF